MDRYHTGSLSWTLCGSLLVPKWLETEVQVAKLLDKMDQHYKTNIITNHSKTWTNIEHHRKT